MHTYTKRNENYNFSIHLFFIEKQKKSDRERAHGERNRLREKTRYTSIWLPNPTHWKCANGSWCVPWTTATECILHGGKRLFDFSICIFFFSFLILLFALFTVELIPWMFCHDNILLNIVYRITMCYANWNILERETTHCFSHNAQTHTCMNTLNGSFVGCLVL